MPKRKRSKNRTEEARDQDAATEDVDRPVLGGMKDPTLNSRISGDGTEAAEDDGGDDGGKGTFTVPFKDKSIVCERRGGTTGQDETSDDAASTALLFTHGAGGGLANPATRDFAIGVASSRNTPVVTFQGTMNLQSRVKTFHAMLEHEPGTRALGGRSMGARAAVLAATQAAEDRDIDALVLVSYPLIGGKKGDVRDGILYDIPEGMDVLFLVGDRDAMCPLDTLEAVVGKMEASVWVVVVEGADHSMSVERKDGVRPLRLETGKIAARWLADRGTIGRRATVVWDGDGGEVAVHTEGSADKPAERAGDQARSSKKRPRRR